MRLSPGSYWLMSTSARISCQSGKETARVALPIGLVISFDSKGPSEGTLKEKRHSGGRPGLALRSVTKTLASEISASEWLTIRYWTSDFLGASFLLASGDEVTMRNPVTSTSFASGLLPPVGAGAVAATAGVGAGLASATVCGNR